MLRFEIHFKPKVPRIRFEISTASCTASCDLQQRILGKVLRVRFKVFLRLVSRAGVCAWTCMLSECLCTFWYVRSRFSRQAYENCVVLEARICYNVAKLMALNAERYALLLLIRKRQQSVVASKPGGFLNLSTLPPPPSVLLINIALIMKTDIMCYCFVTGVHSQTSHTWRNEECTPCVGRFLCPDVLHSDSVKHQQLRNQAWKYALLFIEDERK